MVSPPTNRTSGFVTPPEHSDSPTIPPHEDVALTSYLAHEASLDEILAVLSEHREKKMQASTTADSSRNGIGAEEASIEDAMLPEHRQSNTQVSSTTDLTWTGIVARDGGAAARKPQGFFSLPLELREMCYEWAMIMEGIFDGRVSLSPRTRKFIYELFDLNMAPNSLGSSRRGAVPSFFPAICRVSKQIAEEAASVYLRNNKLEISTKQLVKHLMSFLRTMPDGRGFTAIRSLEFRDQFVGSNLKAFVELASASALLASVKISITAPDTAWLCSYYSNLETLMKSLKLERLLRCKNLRQVTLVAEVSRYFAWPEPYNSGALKTSDLLEELEQWVKKEFRDATIRWCMSCCKQYRSFLPERVQALDPRT
ncbi:hypothetical protein BDV95DRAFT_598165 [Massariosphaeria phaeospora]|uniref:F-box domain-containing protein n=1 Tax=Massariosphaeria phaeospora TaxID=100035 RepID=A0A7C8I441_9PLEO|nr:hypothetical protein BDV95DRAFT_598165 [Massariosphaeria phaeospora]